jgi:HPt (histidine-containing phosphotransfer) domain-containing protein
MRQENMDSSVIDLPKPDAPPPDAEIFNREELMERLGDDRELAVTILKAFLSDFMSQLENLRSVSDQADGSVARLRAHAMKGSAATVSAIRLLTIATEMEKSARAGRLDRFRELLDAGPAEFEKFRSVVEKTGWL